MHKELRIGNLLIDSLTGSLLKVCDVSETGFITTVIDTSKFPLPDGWKAVPILLTEEWLFRFGFKHEIGDYYHKKDHYFGIKFLKGKFTFPSFWHVEIKYLHQLQNLYFALTQEELCLKP
jgi:hypothetical protein